MNIEQHPIIAPLAQELNKIINAASSTTYSLLSIKGKRIFFPSKGILAQAAEAKEKAKPEFNATAGIASDENGPLVFSSIKKYFNQLNKNEIFNYSPSYGNMDLRKLWKERLLEINPSLDNKLFSLPVVTNGLTNALSTVADLFFSPGDEVIIPNQLWGNYKLMLDSLREVKIKYYPFFAESKFNVDSFKNAIYASADENGYAKIILNFPNNPTGYSPEKEEQEKIITIIKQLAESGKKVMVILDEAYHTMFYEDNLMKESFFSYLADIHDNVLAIKICGATKEFFAWGLRVGFITYGIKNGSQELYEALEKKTAGTIRANISNVSTPGQNIIAQILQNKSYLPDFEDNFSKLKNRYLEVKKVVENKKYRTIFTPYPFNSGYFMLIKFNEKITAEKMRKLLLDEAGIGTISTAKHDLRIAFSCLTKKNILTVFEKIYEIGNNILYN